MAIDDPEEFVGTTQQTKADPKGKRTAPRVTPYTPPKAGESHPKTARLGPALRLDAAEANLSAAQLEVTAAYNALRAAEREEAAAVGKFNETMPAPSADQVYRAHLARELDAKVARVEQGLPAIEPKKITARSPVDLAALHRPRPSPQVANAPLRSNVVRR